LRILWRDITSWRKIKFYEKRSFEGIKLKTHLEWPLKTQEVDWIVYSWQKGDQKWRRVLSKSRWRTHWETFLKFSPIPLTQPSLPWDFDDCVLQKSVIDFHPFLKLKPYYCFLNRNRWKSMTLFCKTQSSKSQGKLV